MFNVILSLINAIGASFFIYTVCTKDILLGIAMLSFIMITFLVRIHLDNQDFHSKFKQNDSED